MLEWRRVGTPEWKTLSRHITVPPSTPAHLLQGQGHFHPLSQPHAHISPADLTAAGSDSSSSTTAPTPLAYYEFRSTTVLGAEETGGYRRSHPSEASEPLNFFVSSTGRQRVREAGVPRRPSAPEYAEGVRMSLIREIRD